MTEIRQQPVVACRTDPSVTSELACDLSRGDVPEDHRLVGAAGAKLAVVIGTVETANEEKDIVTSPPGVPQRCVHPSVYVYMHCVQAGGGQLCLTHRHPEPHIRVHCTSSAASLCSRSTASGSCHCRRTAGSSHQLIGRQKRV